MYILRFETHNCKIVKCCPNVGKESKITFKTKQHFSSLKSSSSSLKTKFLVLQLDQTYFYVLYFTYNNSFHIVFVAKKKECLIRPLLDSDQYFYYNV